MIHHVMKIASMIPVTRTLGTPGNLYIAGLGGYLAIYDMGPGCYCNICSCMQWTTNETPVQPLLEHTRTGH